jgi:hypothetical protein
MTSPPTTPLIVVTGASIPYGYGVAPTETFPAQWHCETRGKGADHYECGSSRAT